jgi:hypothetical protein
MVSRRAMELGMSRPALTQLQLQVPESSFDDLDDAFFESLAAEYQASGSCASPATLLNNYGAVSLQVCLREPHQRSSVSSQG